MIANVFHASGRRMALFGKLAIINWAFVALLLAISGVGILMLYSIAGGAMEIRVWAQLVRLSIGMSLFLLVVVIDLRHWMRVAYLIYLVALVSLIVVEVAGNQSMGAQRWLRIASISFQPSELMKIALVLALARYYNMLSPEKTPRLSSLFLPLLLIVMPILLLLRQPDLGTAVLLLLLGLGVLFLAGVRYRYFFITGLLGLCSLPVAWQFMHDYQRQRVMTFLFPEQDPMGAGYHILQSKITLGSGGVWGRGYLEGSQTHLDFLPETETDFIFTVLAEEMGLLGSMTLLLLYSLVLLMVFLVAARSGSQFGRILAMGLGLNFFLHIFFNIAMVTGLIPVVGMPLPLVSYGGSAMVALLIGFGLVMNVHVHQQLSPAPVSSLR